MSKIYVVVSGDAYSYPTFHAVFLDKKQAEAFIETLENQYYKENANIEEVDFYEGL